MAEISTIITIKPMELIVNFYAQECSNRIVVVGSCILAREGIARCIDNLTEDSIIVGDNKWMTIRGLLLTQIQSNRQRLIEKYSLSQLCETAEGP